MRRLLLLALSTAALAVMPTVPVSAAEPWWQVVTNSRPTHLWEPADAAMAQKVTGAKFFDLIFAAKVEVGGETVGCLGSGSLAAFGGPSADEVCEAETGFPASETAAEFETMLEAPYGAGEVEVSGGPAGTAPFDVSSPWGPPIELTVLEALGFPAGQNVSSEVVSEGSGRLVVTLTNLGNAPVDAAGAPLEVVDQLPAGAAAYGVEAEAGGNGSAGPVACTVESAAEVRCSFEAELPPYEAIELEVSVALAGSPPAAGAPGTVTVSGANAPVESTVQEIQVSDDPVPFGIEHFSTVAEAGDGAEAGQAGAHPFQLTTTIVANSGPQSGPNRREAAVAQPALPRNLRFTLPAGLVGSATAVEQCELAVFLQQENFVNKCPDQGAIGVASVTIIEGDNFGLIRLAVPVFNLPPQRGEPARFGLMVAGVPVVISTSVDPSDSYRITAEVRNISQVAQFLASTTTIWGTPGAKAHDESRGWNCAYFEAEKLPGECMPPATRNEIPFLRMPTRCDAPLVYGAAFEPWNVPLGSVVDRATSQSPPLKACNQIPFEPRISSELTSRLAENPSGQEFELFQDGAGFGKTPRGTPEAQGKRIEVTLPKGVTLNPSAAEGLAVCSPGDYRRERIDSKPGDGCPQASKVGTLEATTPLIEEKVEGSLYVAEPFDNPFDDLIALYLVARVPERGVLVKQPLEVEPDERTGRLVVTADAAPQLPYERLRLKLREGGRAPLVTPPRCGDFQTTARFVPWSAQDPDRPAANEVVTERSSFEITRGTDGGACQRGGVPPFAPGFSAGSLNNHGGSYSPFTMRLTRRDGEQDMTRFSAVLPRGVVARLAGVPYCPEVAIAAAKSRDGKDELATPSCPAASQIGRTVAGAGVGSVLTYVPGSLYLAGPYKGAPLSVVAITPAVAGPFDAGTVVVREAVTFNPLTAEVEVDGLASDPIPHILQGIPLKLRDLRVYVERPGFTLNPTSCAEMATRATLFGSFADVLDPADDIGVGVASRFQAAGCQALKFKPRLFTRLFGGTKRGTFPKFRAVLKAGAGEANLGRMVVKIPRSEFVEQGHFRTICTRVQYAADACPKGSVYGRVKAFSPLVDYPLTGPVRLRSSDNELPDLVMTVHGPPHQPIEATAVARIDSIRGQLRATINGFPDVPVTKAIVTMQGGKKGLLVNSRNICRGTNRTAVNMRGQNGKLNRIRPVLNNTRCKKQRRAKSRARRGKS